MSTGWVIVLSLGVCLALTACLEAGYRLGRRRVRTEPGAAHEGIGSIEAAVFALLGLLLAMSFAGATTRLDARRQLIIDEANAIGTAYLRLDLLPAETQPELRRQFRTYLEARLGVYDALGDVEATGRALDRAAALQQEIWFRTVAASQAAPSPAASMLVLPAVNSMIDVTTARTIALTAHLPIPIFGLLVGLSLLSGLFAGYAMAKRGPRSLLHMTVYVVVVSVTIFVVLDVEFPRSGFIRLDAADRALAELRDSIR